MNYVEFLPEYEDVLVPYDLQKILKIGRNTVYNYLAEGVIKSIRVGGKYRIPKLYLFNYLYPNVGIEVYK